MMTQKKAEECLRTAYPEGEIWRDGHKFCVAFKKGGKVYTYSTTTAYEGVLQRLGLDFASMQSKREAELRLADLKAEHGKEKERLFVRKGEPKMRIFDNSAEIARVEAYLAKMTFV